MTVVDPASAAARLARLGFLANPNLPHQVGGAYLLVALRREPSFRHFDPELVEYWVADGGRGGVRRLTRATPLPLDVEFSWGPVRVVDRLGIANEYLAFGGRLTADLVDDVLIAVFTSTAPLLKGGGHSQDWGPAATSVGAFFGRLLLAVDFLPGFEGQVAAATPGARYGAFLADAMARFGSSGSLREAEPDLCRILEYEQDWLRAACPEAWSAGEAIVREIISDRVTTGVAS